MINEKTSNTKIILIASTLLVLTIGFIGFNTTNAYAFSPRIQDAIDRADTYTNSEMKTPSFSVASSVDGVTGKALSMNSFNEAGHYKAAIKLDTTSIVKNLKITVTSDKSKQVFGILEMHPDRQNIINVNYVASNPKSVKVQISQILDDETIQKLKEGMQLLN